MKSVKQSILKLKKNAGPHCLGWQVQTC